MAIFRRLNGAEVDAEGVTIALLLSDGAGTDAKVSFTTECVEQIAITLLEMKATAEAQQDKGVPPSAQAGEQVRVSAQPLASFEVGHVPARDLLVMWLQTTTGAEYRFSLPRHGGDELARQLTTKPKV